MHTLYLNCITCRETVHTSYLNCLTCGAGSSWQAHLVQVLRANAKRPKTSQAEARQLTTAAHRSSLSRKPSLGNPSLSSRPVFDFSQIYNRIAPITGQPGLHRSDANTASSSLSYGPSLEAHIRSGLHLR